MVDENKAIQPKSIAIHTSSYSEYLQRQLGIIDFNVGWGNFFSQIEAGIKLIQNVQDAMKPKQIIDPNTGRVVTAKAVVDVIKHPELILQRTPVYRFFKIWSGRCYITKRRNPSSPTSFIKNSELFHYDTSKINFSDRNLEIIELPALDNLTPIGELKQDVWGVRISESVPFKQAFDECVWDTVVRDGKFKYTVGGKTIAKFQESDMKSETKKTWLVGRPYFYKTIKLLKDKVLESWSPISIDIHRIIQFLEEGYDEDEDYRRPANITTKKLIR